MIAAPLPQSEPIIAIGYERRYDDLEQMYLFNSFERSPTGKQSVLWHRMMIVGIGLAIFGSGAMIGIWRIELASLPFLIFVALFWNGYRASCLRLWCRSHQHGEMGGSIGKRALEIYEKGIWIKSAIMHIFFPWPSIKQIVNAPDCVLIFFDGMMGEAIDKRRLPFSDAADLDNAIALIRTHTPDCLYGESLGESAHPTRRGLVPTLAAFALGFYLVAPGYLRCEAPTYLEESPDGAFVLQACRKPMLIAFPGQGGDAPATVTLRDADGWLIASVDLGMIQNYGGTDGTQWKDGRVSQGLNFAFDLPAGERGLGRKIAQATLAQLRYKLFLAPTDEDFR